jgi:hypothetical protein
MQSRRLAFVVGSMLAGVVGWWVFSGDHASPPLAPSPMPGTVTAAASAERASPVFPAGMPDAAPADAASAEAAGERKAVSSSSGADNRPTATIRGRCVDAQGQPLAGCAVRLHGWGGNRERMDKWLRDHPKPEWPKIEPLTTGADGLFVFTFWPPPPFQFTLGLDRDDLAAMSSRWSSIAEGRIVELGDVVMGPGVRVQGRVVDEAGRPVAKVSVMVRPGDGNSNTGNREEASTVWAAQGRSAEDGSFRCTPCLPPGPFLVSLSSGHELAQPITGVLAIERPIEELTVVLKTTVDVPTIAGRVVDESGQPVPNAEVEARNERGNLTSAWSNRDGTFLLKQKGRAPKEDVPLRATHEQFEATTTKTTVAWGSQDVVLTMVRGGDLAVHVHDDAERQLADFAVRVMPRDTGRFSSDDGKVRARGPFAAGFASVPGIGRGKWTVVVEFPTNLGLAPVFVPIEVTTTAGTRVDVRVPKRGHRPLLVLDGAEQPVAGTVVQLCLPIDGEPNDRASVTTMDQVFMSSMPGRLLELAAAPTNDEGRASLVGPAGVGLAVVVGGPGHVPVRQADVRLDDAAELVIRVQRGARLRGRVGPPEAVAELRRGAGAGRNRDMSIGLVQGEGRQQVHVPWPPRDAQFAITDDGTFDIGGLPSGTWRVNVHYMFATGSGSAFGKQAPAGEVVLRDGETTEFDPDVRAVLPGTLVGVVRRNGAPAPNVHVMLQGKSDGFSVKSDGEGRFRAWLAAGTYRVSLYPANDHEMTWPAAEPAIVVVGETTEQTFQVWTGQLTLTVRDANGALVPRLAVQVVADAPDRALAHFTTDPNGTCTKEMSADSYTLRVLPKRLQSQEAQRKLWEEANAAGQSDPITKHMLVLGTATVVTGQPASVELQLPAEWDK